MTKKPRRSPVGPCVITGCSGKRFRRDMCEEHYERLARQAARRRGELPVLPLVCPPAENAASDALLEFVRRSAPDDLLELVRSERSAAEAAPGFVVPCPDSLLPLVGSVLDIDAANCFRVLWRLIGEAHLTAQGTR